MEAVGVQAAVLDVLPTVPEIQPNGSERYPNSYGERAAELFPNVFASTTRCDPRAPNVDDVIASVRSRPGVLGIRVIIVTTEQVEALAAGVYTGMFAAAARHQVPVMLFISMNLDMAEQVARAHPELQIVIDHFGIPQLPLRPLDDPPFLRLPTLLRLARFPNVAVKFVGGHAYSLEPYPFRDVWPFLLKVVEAFGPQRLMWGSDLTRFRGMLPYSQMVDFVRDTTELSQDDKEWVLGRSLRNILRWPRRL
jgi:predicted TIM-barrel fold metal-dependent hydrolase